jgi:hypothetical protein
MEPTNIKQKCVVNEGFCAISREAIEPTNIKQKCVVNEGFCAISRLGYTTVSRNQ